MIRDLREFEKLLKICRKQGVKNLGFAGVSIEFGDMPQRNEAADDSEPLTPDDLTPEQLAFYSAGIGDQ